MLSSPNERQGERSAAARRRIAAVTKNAPSATPQAGPRRGKAYRPKGKESGEEIGLAGGLVRRGNGAPIMKKIIGVGIILIVLIVIGMNTSKQADNSSTLQGVSDQITDVANNNGNVVVTLETAGNDLYYDFWGMSEALIKAGQWQTRHGAPYSTIDFSVIMPTQDRFGKPGTSSAFLLRYTSDDFRQVDWDNITPWQIVNLAEVKMVTPPGQQLIDAFCADKTSIQMSRPFCAQAY
jgi:hypothetical protein